MCSIFALQLGCCIFPANFVRMLQSWINSRRYEFGQRLEVQVVYRIQFPELNVDMLFLIHDELTQI